MGAQRRGPRTITLTNREELERKHKLSESLGVTMQELIVMESEGTLEDAIKEAEAKHDESKPAEDEKPSSIPKPPAPRRSLKANKKPAPIEANIRMLTRDFDARTATITNRKFPAVIKGFSSQLRGWIQEQAGANFYEADQQVVAMYLFMRLIERVKEDDPEFFARALALCGNKYNYSVYVQAALLTKFDQLIASSSDPD